MQCVHNLAIIIETMEVMLFILAISSLIFSTFFKTF